MINIHLLHQRIGNDRNIHSMEIDGVERSFIWSQRSDSIIILVEKLFLFAWCPTRVNRFYWSILVTFSLVRIGSFFDIFVNFWSIFRMLTLVIMPGVERIAYINFHCSYCNRQYCVQRGPTNDFCIMLTDDCLYCGLKARVRFIVSFG